MAVNFLMPLWVIPTIVTAIIWATVFLWRYPKPTGGYDFGTAFCYLLGGVLGVTGTLVTWLIFFIFV